MIRSTKNYEKESGAEENRKKGHGANEQFQEQY